MRSLIRAVHDIWCAVTHRCRVMIDPRDPTFTTLIQHEQAAYRAADASRHRQRQRQVHFYEDDLLARIRKGGSRGPD